jgi:two-component system phosphate regulon response regulator OmpR
MSVMHNIRQGGNSVPIIMIFSKNSSIEITKMLDSGADDCISIPFGTREFVSRVNAVLRRRSYSLQ